MCRYGTCEYKEHFVCFGCRFAAKYEYFAPLCPHCREPMIAMGKDFKPPRKRSDTQWKKIELLFEQGIIFRSCGCTGPGPRPKTYAGAKQGTWDRGPL